MTFLVLLMKMDFAYGRKLNGQNLLLGFGNKEVCFTYLEVPYISDPLKNDQFQQETEFANCQIHYHGFKQSVSGKEMFHIKLHQITEWPESKKVIILFLCKE